MDEFTENPIPPSETQSKNPEKVTLQLTKSEPDQTETSKARTFSRRTFLKGLVGAGAAVALGGSQSPTLTPELPKPPSGPKLVPPETAVLPEQEQQKNLDSLVIDISGKAFSNLEEYGIPSLSEEGLAEKLGIEGGLSLEKLLSHKVTDDENLTKAMIVQIVKFIYGDHGEEVVRTTESVDRLLGVESPNRYLSLFQQAALKILR